MEPLVISRQDAIRAQLLTAQRATDLVSAVTHLTMLQLDSTSAVELVTSSRLGASFHPEDLATAVTNRRLLGIHEHSPLDINGVRAELGDLARWLDVDLHMRSRDAVA